MTKETLIDLWLDAEEELRNENDEKCLEMKKLFIKEIVNFSKIDKIYIEDYLESIGA
tara:strand:+ start:1913 stop:2083 length:171 start_codon:yes stop_codon:yes gene_type:complete